MELLKEVWEKISGRVSLEEAQQVLLYRENDVLRKAIEHSGRILTETLEAQPTLPELDVVLEMARIASQIGLGLAQLQILEEEV